MQPILTHAEQFPWRVATARQTMAANNSRSGARLTDEELQQLRHLLNLASRITVGAVIQPGDTSSGGPMFSGGDSFLGPASDPPADPPTSIADATAVPNADFEAQRETGHGAWW